MTTAAGRWQPARHGGRPDLLISLTIGLALCGVQISWILCHALNYDEAYNAQVPLNVVLRGTYGTWYHHSVPFNVHITTGPPVLLPAAAALWLFGSPYWSLRLVMAAFFAGFLWLSHRTIAGVAGRLAPAGFAAFAALLLFIPFGLETASLLLGEVPGLGFLLAAGILMRRAATRGKGPLTFAAGILLGLAVLTKLVLVVCAAGFFAALVFCAELRGRWRTIGHLACWAAAGTALPLLGWQLVMLGSLGWKGYLSNVEELHRWMVFAGSGLNMKAADPARGPWAHVETLARVLRVSPRPLAGSLACATGALLWVFLRRPLPFPAWSLLLATFALWTWWIGFSSWLFYRHLLHGYLLLSILLPLGACAAITDRGKGRISRLAAALVLTLSAALCFAPRMPWPALQRERMLASQLAAAAFVEKAHQRNPAATFWGVGWQQAPQISLLARMPFRDLSRDSPKQEESYLVIEQVSRAIPEIQAYARRHCARWVFRRNRIWICRLAKSPPLAPPDRIVRHGLMP